jgi:hypothetical protein
MLKMLCNRNGISIISFFVSVRSTLPRAVRFAKQFFWGIWHLGNIARTQKVIGDMPHVLAIDFAPEIFKPMIVSHSSVIVEKQKRRFSQWLELMEVIWSNVYNSLLVFFVWSSFIR